MLSICYSKDYMSNKIIGFDLDNTIIDYSSSFRYLSEYLYGYTKNKKLLNKDNIKKFIIEKYDESKWTRVQGIIYSFLMEKAVINDKFFELLDFLEFKKYKILIISHRSIIPDSGDPYDLQLFAKRWINKNICEILEKKAIEIDYFLLETYKKKIDMIKKISPSFFIDDLYNVCQDVKDFTNPILFGNKSIVSHDKIISIKNFSNVLTYFRKVL